MTGKSQIIIGNFTITRLGRRPEDNYQFTIHHENWEAEFAATGTIVTDASGKGTGFLWSVTFVRLLTPNIVSRTLKQEVTKHIRSFLKSYCPDIHSYELKEYSEIGQFKRWVEKE